MRAAALLLLLAAAPSRAAGLDEPTRAKLAEALACVNLSVEDLGWDKRPVKDRFRSHVVNRALDDPLALAELAEDAEAAFGSATPNLMAAGHWLSSDSMPVPWLQDVPADAAKPPARSVLLDLTARFQRARAARLQFVGPEEATLRESGRLYLDDSEEDWGASGVLRAAEAFNVVRLIGLLESMGSTADVARRLDAAAIAEGVRRSRTWTVDGVRVALGGAGPDVHAAEVVLDVGGDDTYGPTCAFVVDLAGDDTYRDAGSGFMTVGLIVDRAGNDRYVGEDFTQGGALWGAAILVDEAGDDIYQAGQCSQGAAVFGFGLLLDLAGRDDYRGDRFVQGFGGVGGLGVLSDRAGEDSYRVGGRFKHEPLLPESYQSLSQGFGFGLRGLDASGGVGMLLDGAGNDTYSAEVYGQGASYWLALGILVDSGGNDKYDLYQYGQGAGIHLSSGVLLDRAGDDGYTCNNGVAQGCGHDWAVGLLWDRAGNDAYQGSGMTQGSSNANGIGVLVDEKGNDSYGGWNEKIQGDSFPARGTVGLGVLLDVAGKDKYTHGGNDGLTWTRGSLGVGMDVPDPAPATP